MAFDRVSLAAVEGQLRRHHSAVTVLLVEPVGQPSGSYRLSLMGIAYQPQLPVLTGRYGGHHSVGLAGGHLAELVHHQHRPRLQHSTVHGEPGDRHRLYAHLAKLFDRLVRGRQRECRPPGSAYDFDRHRERGGLPVSGWRDQRPKARTSAGEYAHSTFLVETQRTDRYGSVDHGRFEPFDLAVLQTGQVVEHPVLELSMRHGGPPAGCPTRGVVDYEADHLLRVQEHPHQGLDPQHRQAAGAPSGHRLDHLSFAEAGVMPAQSQLRVDEASEQPAEVADFQLSWRGVGLDRGQQLAASWQADGLCLGPPALLQLLGVECAVFGRPGQHAGRLVGLHPGLGIGRLCSDGGQMLLDLQGAFREHSPLLFADPDHLPASVAVRTPADPEPF
jgi:hypothetical protein